MNPNQKDVTIHISSGSIIKTIVIIIFFIALVAIRDLLLVLLTAIVVASALEPIVKWFVGYKMPRLLSVLVVYAGMVAVLLGAIYFLMIPLIGETSSFLGSLPGYLNSVDIHKAPQQAQSFLQILPDSFSLGDITTQLNQITTKFSGGFFSIISSVFGGVFSFVLILIFSFYLAVQEDGVGKFLKLISPVHHKKYVANLWSRAENKIGLWMQGQILLAVIIAVLVYLGLALFGIEHALLLACLAGLFELIPLFGPILAAVPAIAVTFMGHGFSSALFIAAFFVIVQQFENQLIYPLVVKKVVGVPPIISIIALLIGGQLAGFLGVLISVPLAAIALEFLGDIDKNRSEELHVTS